MSGQSLQFPIPLKGKNDAWARGQQPQGTCPDALNVMPVDRGFRRRISQRMGTVKLHAAALSGGAAIQGQAVCTLYDASAAAYRTLLVVVAGAEVFTSEDLVNFTSRGSLSYLPATGRQAQIITARNACFFIDTDGVSCALRRLELGARTAIASVTPVADDARCTASLAAHGYATGDVLTIAGTDQGYYDGVRSITRIDADHFRYDVPGVGIIVSPATGAAITAQRGAEAAQAITALSSARLYGPAVTVTTATSHHYTGTLDLTISGVTPAPTYAGSFAATVTGTLAFTIAITPTTSAPIVGDAYVVADRLSTFAPAYMPARYTCGCIYRSRLVLAGAGGGWAMSRSGNYLDWAAAKDSARPVAGTELDDPIVAVIPLGTDTLVLAGDRRLTRIVGDLAAGGQVIPWVDGVGIAGPNAWCLDPQGSLWMLASDGLRRAEGTSLTPVSAGILDSWFHGLNRATQALGLVWDRDRGGLWCLACPLAPGAGSVVFWDAGVGGFWPQQFPTGQGPLSAVVWDGPAANDRALLLGGRDGFVRKLSATATTDDGTAIHSLVYLGPVAAPPGELMLLNRLLLTLGEPVGDVNVAWTLAAAATPNLAVTAPAITRSGTLTAGGPATPAGLRLRGASFVLKLENTLVDTVWSLEDATTQALAAGRAR